MSRACHTLRKSQVLKDGGASVILVIKIFSCNMILKYKLVNSTKETKIYSEAGGKVGIVEIIER